MQKLIYLDSTYWSNGTEPGDVCTWLRQGWKVVSITSNHGKGWIVVIEEK